MDEEDTLCDNEEAWLESVDTNEHRLNSEKRKKKQMSSYELSEIVVAKRIKTRTELLALAREQKLESKTDIAEFIINRGSKVVAEIFESAWEMEDAQKTLERQRKGRLQLLQEARLGECVENCNGDWLICAREVLERNGVEESYFAEQVYELLDKGRGKYRNIKIVGVANCGKTFLLNPLNVIYNTFWNVSTMRAENCSYVSYLMFFFIASASNIFLMMLNMFSMGFKSGLRGGIASSFAPTFFNAVRASALF